MPSPGTPENGGVRNEYECLECGQRLREDSHPGSCPDCDGELQNLSVDRRL